MAGLSADDFCTWAKTYNTGYDVHAYLAMDKCIKFEREIWFEVGKYMWRKHWSVYQDHIKYIHNDIVKPFRVKILHYAKHIIDMHDLDKYLPPSSMKSESAEAANWTVCNREFMASEIWLTIKDRTP